MTKNIATAQTQTFDAELVRKDAANLIDALKKAATLLGVRDDFSEAEEVVEAAGLDAVLVHLSSRWLSSEVSLHREARTTFRLGTSLEMRVSARDGNVEEPAVVVRVTWASGGGDVSPALAALRHHMMWLEKAAMVEEILNDRVRSISGRRGTGPSYFRAVMKAASDVAEAEFTRASAVMDAHRASKKEQG